MNLWDYNPENETVTETTVFEYDEKGRVVKETRTKVTNRQRSNQWRAPYQYPYTVTYTSHTS